MRKIQFITLHTAGAADKLKAVHQSSAVIRDFHVRVKGWKDIGYHCYVEQNGSVGQYARAEELEPAAVEGWNGNILALCVSGHGDLEPWNPRQLVTVISKCVDWCRKYNLPSERVIGHHEADEYGAPKVFKTCPGLRVDVAAIRAQVATALGETTTGGVQRLLAEMDNNTTGLLAGEVHDLANDLRIALGIRKS